MKCPTCDSPAPHLHPAVQFEGEVSVCIDQFHLQPTPQNLWVEVVAACRMVALGRTADAVARGSASQVEPSTRDKTS